MDEKTQRSMAKAKHLVERVLLLNGSTFWENETRSCEFDFICPSQTEPGKTYVGHVGFNGAMYFSGCSCRAHWPYAEGTPLENMVHHNGVQSCKHAEAAGLAAGWEPLDIEA